MSDRMSDTIVCIGDSITDCDRRSDPVPLERKGGELKQLIVVRASSRPVSRAEAHFLVALFDLAGRNLPAGSFRTRLSRTRP